MITNKGKQLWANALGNLRNGFTDTLKEATATSLIISAGTPWVAEALVGQDVYAEKVVGTIVANTNKELTVARWEKLPNHTEPALNRSEKGSPPAESSRFFIVSGAVPAAWIALTADTAEPKPENETLKSEIKTSEGGLIRALATFTYTTGNKYKVEAVFTSNVHDTLPVTVAKIGIFNAQAGGVLMFETLLSATAEVTAVGDSVSISDIVTGS